MPAKTNERTTVSVEREALAVLGKIAERHDWSVGQAAAEAINALRVLMEWHEQIAKGVEPDVAELYMRIARESPMGLMAPKRDTQLGWSNETREQPVFLLDGRYIYADPETDGLMAVDDSGRHRWHYVGGEFIPVKAPSPKKAVLKALT